MISLAELLKVLLKPGVTELGIAGGRVPAAKVSSTFRPLGAQPLQAADVLRLLSELGMDPSSFGDSPTRWGGASPVGPVTVVAARMGDNIQARIALATPAAGS